MKKTLIIVIAIVVLAVIAIFASSHNRREAATCAGTECLPQFMGVYVMTSPAADASKLTRTLRLLPGGTLALESSFSNGKPAINEIGSWYLEDSSHINAVISGQSGDQYHSENRIMFEKSGSKLTAVEYDQSLYGTEGLRFTKTEDYVPTATDEKYPLPGRDGTDITPTPGASDDPNTPKLNDHGGPVGQPPVTTTVTVPYGEVTLTPGATAHFKDADIKVGTTVEDSRCPTGVQCIWAGTVNVTLTITTSAGVVSTQKISLDAPGANPSNSAVSAGKVSIMLIGVKPYPAKDKPIRQSDYKLTFDVKSK